ncbi:hypothetical protein L208DRAFT_1387292 [Tricholoma matsutake]|nr:hypothetical protein L208DRAFT_1387292 [Tricholoma matsutake 945]
MAPSDSEDDNLEDFEYDGDDDPDADVDDEPLDGGADDATEEADDVCFSEWDSKLALTTISPCRGQDFRIGGL